MFEVIVCHPELVSGSHTILFFIDHTILKDFPPEIAHIMRMIRIFSKNVYSESDKTVVTLLNLLISLQKNYEQCSKTNTFRNEQAAG
jgi:hypothetical protein